MTFSGDSVAADVAGLHTLAPLMLDEIWANKALNGGE